MHFTSVIVMFYLFSFLSPFFFLFRLQVFFLSREDDDDLEKMFSFFYFPSYMHSYVYS